MKKQFYILSLCAILLSACTKENIIEQENISGKEAAPGCWYEGTHNKYNKVVSTIDTAAGTSDTSNVSVEIYNTLAHQVTPLHPATASEEIIHFPSTAQHPAGNFAFAKGSTLLFAEDNILSHCTYLLDELSNKEGVYYIVFKKDGEYLNTSGIKYATPLGDKKTMKLNL